MLVHVAADCCSLLSEVEKKARWWLATKLRRDTRWWSMGAGWNCCRRKEREKVVDAAIGLG